MTCANCSNPSDYLISDPGANPIELCNLHLPEHMRERAAAGQFSVTPPPEPVEVLPEDE